MMREARDPMGNVHAYHVWWDYHMPGAWHLGAAGSRVSSLAPRLHPVPPPIGQTLKCGVLYEVD